MQAIYKFFGAVHWAIDVRLQKRRHHKLSKIKRSGKQSKQVDRDALSVNLIRRAAPSDAIG